MSKDTINDWIDTPINDWEEVQEGRFDEISPEAIPSYGDDEMGSSEAFLRHAGESTSFGLTDLATGAGAAAIEAFPTEGDLALEKIGATGDIRNPKKAYYDTIKEQEMLRGKALEDAPLASVAGTLTGAFATPLPGSALAKTGKVGKGLSKLLPNLQGYDKITKARKLEKTYKGLEKAKQAQKFAELSRKMAIGKAGIEGLKTGAIYGAVKGESRLLEGDFMGAIEDSATGAAVGAGTAILFEGGVESVRQVVRKNPSIQRLWSSFMQGVKNKARNYEIVADEIRKTGKEYFNKIVNMKKSLGKKYEAFEQLAEMNNITINTKEDLDRIYQIANAIEDNTLRKDVQAVIDALRPYVGDQAEAMKAQMEKSVLKKQISKIGQLQEASIKAERQALKKQLKGNEQPLGFDEDVISAADVIPEGNPTTKATVRRDITEGMEKGVKTQTPDDTIITHTDFVPSKVQTEIDPATGRLVGMYQDLGSGKVTSKIGDVYDNIDPSNINYKRAKELESVLEKFTILKGDKTTPKHVQAEITKAVKSIENKRRDALKDLEIGGLSKKQLDENYEALKLAEKEIGISGAKTKEVVQNTEDKIFEAITQGDDQKYRRYTQRIIQDLEKTQPKLAKDITSNFNKLRELYLTQRGTGTLIDPSIRGVLLGNIKEIAQNITHKIGIGVGTPYRLTKGVMKDAAGVANKSFEFVKMKSPQIEQIANKLSTKGNVAQPYVNALKKAANSPEKTKNAILYGLYKTPAFRALLEEEE